MDDLKIPKKLADMLDNTIMPILYNGAEYGNPNPLSVPADKRIPRSTQQTIDILVRKRLSQIAEDQGYETEEEANDLNVDDGWEMEGEPLSGYEFSELQEEVPKNDPYGDKESSEEFTEGRSIEVNRGNEEEFDKKEISSRKDEASDNEGR